MKQQEAEKVSKFALKKKSKNWEVFDREKASCIFTGKVPGNWKKRGEK